MIVAMDISGFSSGHWGIGGWGWSRDVRPPLGPIYFISTQFSGKFWPNRLGPPLGLELPSGKSWISHRLLHCGPREVSCNGQDQNRHSAQSHLARHGLSYFTLKYLCLCFMEVVDIFILMSTHLSGEREQTIAVHGWICTSQSTFAQGPTQVVKSKLNKFEHVWKGARALHRDSPVDRQTRLKTLLSPLRWRTVKTKKCIIEHMATF